MKGFLKPKLILPLVTVVLLASAILVPLAGNAIHSHAQGTGVSVNIPATQPYTDTGIDITVGSSLSITASGVIFITPSDTGHTPAGSPSCIATSGFNAPGLTCWSLIAKIGANGKPFEVGTSTGLSVATSGRLFLGVNDNVFSDNSGSWTASVTVTPPSPSPRKQLVIFLQGINTSQGSLKPGQIVGLGSIPKTVKSVLGTNADYLEYSYADTTTGSPYSCANTIVQPIKQDISLLNQQIANAVGSNRNTDIYLIGHSLGGVVAFGYLALLEEQLKTSLSEGVSLPHGAHLRAVITLDSPIGGVRGGRFSTFSKFLLSVNLGISGFPCEDLAKKPFAGKPLATVDDLVSVFRSPFFHPGTTPPEDAGPDPQGAQASLLAISGVKLPSPPTPKPPPIPVPAPTPAPPLPLPSNEMLAEGAHTNLGTSFLSVGNTNDFLWNPSPCASIINPLIRAALPTANLIVSTIPSFIDTQFLEDEGDNSALYGRSITVPMSTDCTQSTVQNKLNHVEVLTNTDVRSGIKTFLTPIAVASGPVGGTPLDSSGKPLPINPFQPTEP